ncbi:ParB N-terminal domain-containing protein [Litorivita sp. NS0012-18]|uniref:ParB/RepB/Spo0J family partition protein n=1 Tax=Litorivita sp. NS0012-18 TaxID=3127655 RepID=UPI0031072222
MAKRKRLTPARAAAPEGAAPETKSGFPLGVARHAPAATPPIAHVAGQAASEAALRELADDVRRARDEGRLVQSLPLDTVDEGYLVRDRIAVEASEMTALMESLRARGQQTPIEVVELDGGRFGLISGWRRLSALRELSREDPARFGTIQALLRRPETASDAYRAMVEENEIRVGLSYYERARIVARAASEGVFADTSAALSGLFASASRAKRSKIGSFLRLHDALDDRLHFASAIPERLGLALVKALEADKEFAARLRDRLRKTPPASAADEISVLERAIDAHAPKTETVSPRNKVDAAPKPAEPQGVQLQRSKGRLVISGAGVTETFEADLRDWLAARLSNH